MRTEHDWQGARAVVAIAFDILNILDYLAGNRPEECTRGENGNRRINPIPIIGPNQKAGCHEIAYKDVLQGAEALRPNRIGPQQGGIS